MADVFDTKKRSEVMSRIRGKGNKSTEVALAAALRRARISGWRRHVAIKLEKRRRRDSSLTTTAQLLVVSPDFVFKKARVAVFVDGCFWHQCPLHSTVPKNNRDFWKRKLEYNAERDRLVNRELKKAGWAVVRVWEHEVSASPTSPTRKVALALKRQPRERTM